LKFNSTDETHSLLDIGHGFTGREVSFASDGFRDGDDVRTVDHVGGVLPDHRQLGHRSPEFALHLRLVVWRQIF
jgi:hypothetical protein